ncbi:MAG: T9SS type A sorting domain-containing protein [Paludibacter sp.]|nr:T9SS type A sorting domain-containing protein [Paludibacter sp.]
MKLRLLTFTTACMLLFVASAQTVIINESAGWLESAYLKWQPVEGAESFNIYVSGEGLTDKKIDNQLIRNYGTYYRADVLGLKAGSYTIKVAPVIANIEGEATTTGTLTVEAHDRTGFAFMNGRVPGAYKADGTPKDNAVILYITQNTKNTVSLEVTGANANPCVGLQTIFEGFKKGKDFRPLIVRLVGQITDLSYMDKGDIVIENANHAASYITLEGVGDDAVADGWGIRLKNATNIEIRNIGTMNCNSDEGDNIGLQQDNEHIWIHHCDFFYGDAGSAADQAKGDGALDSKRSGFVTFSYNHFWDTGKSNLLGNGTEDPRYLTYHHNWYDHSDSRHPRVRSHSVHVYNNYYDGISKYGVGSTLASSVFVEANYFRNCRYPMLTSMQGSDVWDESKQANDYSNMPTFSKEDGGSIKAFNNYMTGHRRFVAYGASGFPNSTVDFDAYVATTRNETVSSSVKSSRGSNTYNNFDTNPAVMYTYTPDSPEEARDKVIQFAGRMHGGDFKWTFNNAVDDTSYDVNPALKAALAGYTTNLVSVQGDGDAIGGGDPDDGDPDDGEPSGAGVHNFTLSGKTSTFFNITGNLSDTKGTVNYAGLTLTQCLKIESSTTISFTTTQESILTLVFNSDFSGKIKLNGVDVNASSGIVTTTIPAGSHQITKGDTSNLFYIKVVSNTTGIKNATIPALIVYPNPVVNSLSVASGIEVNKLEIYSISGTLVHRSEGIINSIDVSHLSSGSYLVRIYTAQAIMKQMIIKK